MVVAAFGVPGLTVLELSYMLNQLKVTYGVVRQNSLEKIETDLEFRHSPVVFNSVSSFLKNHARFKSKIVALITDDPFTLVKRMDLPILGASVQKNKFVFTPFSPQDLAQLLQTDFGDIPEQEFKKRMYDPVPEILKGYNTSVLASLQTQLYRIKALDTRDQVNRMIKMWFVSKESTGSLESKIRSAAGNKVASIFGSMLRTPEMQTLRVAVRKTKLKPEKVAIYAKKFKISAFDIKYILASKS